MKIRKKPRRTKIRKAIKPSRIKIRKEKIQVAVYGVRKNFRFSFYIKFVPSDDIQKNIKKMIRMGRREAKHILKKSRIIARKTYGGRLEKIVWLSYDNGLKVEV